MLRRVVVTGLGALTPLGNTFAESWDALQAGKSGLAPSEGELTGQWAGTLKGFDAGSILSSKEMRRLDLFIQYALSTSLMAVEDAGLTKLASAGVIIGSCRGGITSLEHAMRGRASAYLMPSTTIGMAPSAVAGRLGIKGHCLGISNSCSSGANAIGEAYRLIKHGICDVVLAGGADAPLCKLSIEGYSATGALSRQGIMRPFDRKRDGFILAEGSAILVLEEYKSALKRGVRPYAEIAGYANTVAAVHQTRPEASGQIKAIMDALKEAGLSVSDIDYVNAHATATPIGDRVEAGTLRHVFGERKVPVSSNKSMTGHMLGASGAFEAGSTAMSLLCGIIPATANLTEPDCDLHHVMATGVFNPGAAISNSFGFGGVNAVLVFKAVKT